MATTDFSAQVSGLGALADPLREQLYRYVCEQPAPVSIDDAAAATGMARHTAKFHLDRLAVAGLLDTEYRRPPGRTGPGAGRPTKFFRRSATEVSVSLPERHYDLAAHVLAEAIQESVRDASPVLPAVIRVAAEVGADVATDSGGAEVGDAGERDPVAATCRALATHGYEPRRDEATITLANCPFHSLAKEHTELVCGMNLALVGAISERLGEGKLQARLDPAEDRCCVVLAVT